jgi:hypothetical protein
LCCRALGACGHSEIFRELRFAASVERVRNHALIHVRRDATDIAFAEKNTFSAALRPPGVVVWLKEHYPDAEQKIIERSLTAT